MIYRNAEISVAIYSVLLTNLKLKFIKLLPKLYKLF